MSEVAFSEHSKVRRVAKRASYDKSTIYSLIDELKLGHVGFIVNNRPVVIPMTVWRVEDHLYLHVANKSRIQRLLEEGGECSISFAAYKEWVMSKSAYHHSANYCSAVVYCTGRRVTAEDEFDRAFEVIINQLEEGRWDRVRPPNKLERKATALMKMTINEGAFKARTGEPIEEPEDLSLPVWNGTKPVCPYHQ
ncbi:pyridoxamine 5'-phosphate oxidase family protein [Alkalimarinus sediminis]|uniref:Pyridoxamine 5'-phosphate oxidase family protein n=1 Tax=Alkalimarinus sediminis TaxID=1632866 RepID=A0A9E8HFC2_9ALTE|nr:pyridoxamine 5'-phosphate oxidase family protein [Alkalimarinus sediminis]UZW73605.1 pyridoxamine 5'-phosphate oxidase family protein [Alkalimarinus sediminis]